MPDVVDNLGRQFLRFTQFQFELVNSDLLDQARHQVAVNFYAKPLRWHDAVGPYLLVSVAALAGAPGGEVLTRMFQPYLATRARHPGAPAPRRPLP